ncbi:MAG: aminotransferase class V-fold PLP-dependent enzyme, partial [Mariprofundaceae bacterium]
VQYASGLRLNLQRLGDFCRENDIIFCVDAIQSLGALCFDAEACHIDVVTADGHKWMLGPEGLAVLYVRPELRKHINLHQYGWHMVERAGDFDRRDWQVADSARCFEPGSPNMLGIQALSASLSLFEDVGMDVVQTELMQRAHFLTAAVQADNNLVLLSPADADRMSGIVNFRRRDLNDAEHATLYRHLMASGVICALRGGGIRFSPHFYTPMAQLETAIAMVVDFTPF